jgi:hypothetical protein
VLYSVQILVEAPAIIFEVCSWFAQSLVIHNYALKKTTSLLLSSVYLYFISNLQPKSQLINCREIKGNLRNSVKIFSLKL